MCYSNVSLFYGLWVKTWSLAFAADAHEKVHPTLLAIDFICSRRKKGQLIAEVEGTPKRTVADLPAEIWDMVKQEIVDHELRKVEEQVLRQWRCPDCLRAVGDPVPDWYEPLSPVAPNHQTWKRWGWPTCETCIYLLGCMDPPYWLEDADRQKRCKSLLSSFGVCLILAQPYKNDSARWHDFDEASPLSIPFQDSHPEGPQHWHQVGSHATSTACHGYVISGSTVLDVSPNALRMPADVDSRFSRLINLFRLQVIDCAKNSITPFHQQTEQGGGLESSDDVEGHVKEENEVWSADQPRWVLWTYGTTF